MSEPAVPPAVAALLNAAPQTFADLGARIAAAVHPAPWSARGAWAADVLAGVLGNDWLGKFQQRYGQPYLNFVLAEHLLPRTVSLTELAAALRVLDGSQGMGTVLSQMRSQLEPGVVNSARLQFEVAALEKRRSGNVAMEVDRGPGNWKPDVMLSCGPGPFGVECLYLSMGADVADHFRDAATAGAEVDGWKRIGAKLATKAGQPAQDGGWLRCHLDDGMFANEAYMQSALVTMPLERRGTQLAQGALEQMAISGNIHGVVFSGLPRQQASQSDEEHNLPDGAIALRRVLPGGRVRETFIIPNTGTANSERDVWFELYDQEPSWLQWALEQLRSPDGVPA